MRVPEHAVELKEVHGRVVPCQVVADGLRDHERDHEADDIQLELLNALVQVLVLAVPPPNEVVAPKEDEQKSGDNSDEGNDHNVTAAAVTCHLDRGTLRVLAQADAGKGDEVCAARAEGCQAHSVVAPQPSDHHRDRVQHDHLDHGKELASELKHLADLERLQELPEGVEPEHRQEDRGERVQHLHRQLVYPAIGQCHRDD
mmetsp:Transcript_27943/g.80150  ORF Transcript_27943/g.80150 Transcript_27943/m.80150 type:complete len:201 (+) Transcript_27943:686-1288(+)